MCVIIVYLDNAMVGWLTNRFYAKLKLFDESWMYVNDWRFGAKLKVVFVDFLKSSLIGCRRGALGGSLVGLPKAAYPCHIANTCSAPTTDSTQLSTFIKNIFGLYITSNALHGDIQR